MSVTPHIHIGAVEFIVFGLYLIVWGFLLRALEIVWHNNPIGQGFAFLY